MTKMKCRLSVFFALFFIIMINTAMAHADEYDFLNNFSLGPIKRGMSAEQLVKTLGQPTKKGAFESESGTDGEGENHAALWLYPEKGLKITLYAEDTKGTGATVQTFEAESPCILKTSDGIGIGSSFERVKQVYSAYKERFKKDAESILIGPQNGWAYISFDFKKGLLSKINIVLAN